MSLSLLNTYDSSDDSSEEDQPSNDDQKTTEQTADQKRTKNFFIGDGDSDSEQSSDSHNSDNETDEDHSTQDGTSKIPLPRPFDNSLEHDTSSVSVFRNPYMEAEQAETVLLEKHVKLTETAYRDRLNEERRKVKKSSLPCRQFRRGRCRLGDKCRFSHSVVPTATPDGLPATSSAPEESPSAPSIYDGKAVRYTEWGKEEIVDQEGESEGKKPKKRRVGVTNSLIPPKRSLANYEKQRREESPWMN